MLEILDGQVNLPEILEHIPVPAGLISLESGKYVAVNLALQELARYGEDVRNHLLSLILDKPKIQRLQQGEIIQNCELEIPTSHCQACAFLLSAKLVTYKGDRWIFCVLQDVTDYKIQKLRQLGIQQTLESDLQESAIPSIHILQKLLDQLVACNPCILYIFDLDRQTTLYINHQSLDKLGYTPANLDNISQIAQLVWVGDRPAVIEHFANCRHLAQRQTCTLDYRIQLADQSLHWWRSYHTPLVIDDTGLVRQIVGVAIDITPQKQAEQALAESKQLGFAGAEEVVVSVQTAQQHQLELAQAQEITAWQRRIFVILSHEFRTPLSTILGSVELLQHSHAQWLDDKAKRNLNRIVTSVQDALELLENMLTLSSADAGNLQVKPQYINLRRFTEELVDSITTERQIVMEFKTSGEDYMGYTDPFLLRRLLLNLLNNAIKYSAHDTEIRVFLLINMEQDQAIWQVIDRGIGIPIADIEQIFLPWKRGSNTDNRRGTGLGLSVVQNCVNAIGGVISVLSKENVGTTFTVIVPIAGTDDV